MKYVACVLDFGICATIILSSGCTHKATTTEKKREFLSVQELHANSIVICLVSHVKKDQGSFWFKLELDFCLLWSLRGNVLKDTYLILDSSHLIRCSGYLWC